MRWFISFFLLLTITCHYVSAQEIKGWRIKSGTNIATQKWENQSVKFVDITYKSGQFYEVGREIKIKPFLSVVPSLAYQEMGFCSTIRPEVIDPGDYKDYINHFRYVTLQAAFKLQPPNGKFKPYLMAGYQGGVLLSSYLDAWSSFVAFLQRVRHYDDGPVLTLGFEMETGKGFMPFLEFSHYRSVRNVLKNNLVSEIDVFGEPIIPVDVRNRVYTVGGGIKF